MERQNREKTRVIKICATDAVISRFIQTAEISELFEKFR
jgi:hypothetical protein